MDRREALKAVSLMMGGTVIGANTFLAACSSPPEEEDNSLFSQKDRALFDEIGETIIPATTTPGAKAAGIGSFIAMMITDCYTPKQQKIFIDGIDQFKKYFSTQYDNTFIDSSPEKRTAFLNHLDNEQKENTAAGSDQPHYFRMLKELTLLGYFTSEIGCTQARNYIETPGKYDGCVEYKKGMRAWAV